MNIFQGEWAPPRCRNGAGNLPQDCRNRPLWRSRLRPSGPLFAVSLTLLLAGCVSTDLASVAPQAEPKADEAVAGGSSEVDRLISHYATVYEVPEVLVRRVVKRESNFNPTAYNGGHYGLMQIKPATARTMGFRGEPRGLLDAETNLTYAVKYLRGAYMVADGNHDRAVRFYASGYYYDAKRRGMLEATGLGKDRRRMRRN